MKASPAPFPAKKSPLCAPLISERSSARRLNSIPCIRASTDRKNPCRYRSRPSFRSPWNWYMYTFSSARPKRNRPQNLRGSYPRSSPPRSNRERQKRSKTARGSAKRKRPPATRGRPSGAERSTRQSLRAPCARKSLFLSACGKPRSFLFCHFLILSDTFEKL